MTAKARARLMEPFTPTSARDTPELLAAACQLLTVAAVHHPSLVDALCFPTSLADALLQPTDVAVAPHLLMLRHKIATFMEDHVKSTLC